MARRAILQVDMDACYAAPLERSRWAALQTRSRARFGPTAVHRASLYVKPPPD